MRSTGLINCGAEGLEPLTPTLPVCALPAALRSIPNTNTGSHLVFPWIRYLMPGCGQQPGASRLAQERFARRSTIERSGYVMQAVDQHGGEVGDLLREMVTTLANALMSAEGRSALWR
jgi:hypothetical protein